MQIIAIVLMIFFAVCGYQIARKAGYNPWLGLLAAIPIVHLVLLLILAFSEWPIHRGESHGG
ncbi:hypothetical protein VCB98_04315 [Gammaproteobacteria bacterium AB-CW1]|uniref:Uncharacterized protein n=1 Tax=Natronospira elongata TaxID=3110268 RepID=A0AAP6JEK4_9GAMM|nr:hypothetical protein [Gammaproteobacteria bacterium AB-CW1]